MEKKIKGFFWKKPLTLNKKQKITFDFAKITLNDY
jgi:hypothetical protein